MYKCVPLACLYKNHSALKAIPKLKIVTNTVASATNISSLVTKNSDLVAIIMTTFDDQ